MKQLLILFTIITFSFLNRIAAQELTTFPGFFGQEFYQDEFKISKEEVGKLMAADIAANELWSRSNRHMTYSTIALGAGAVGYLWYAIDRDSKGQNAQDASIIPLVGAIGASIISFGYQVSSENLQKKSILMYNKNRNTGSLDLGPTYNGLGLVLSF